MYLVIPLTSARKPPQHPRPSWRRQHLRHPEDFNRTLCGLQVLGPRRYHEVGSGYLLTAAYKTIGCRNCQRAHAPTPTKVPAIDEAEKRDAYAEAHGLEEGE
jgi:hypothetical protein